jgi:hypothetical protein
VNRLKLFVERNPVRVAAWVSSTVAIALAAFAPDVPVEPVVIFVLSSLGLGEYAQRVEDAKTEAAYWTDPLPEPVKKVAKKAAKA